MITFSLILKIAGIILAGVIAFFIIKFCFYFWIFSEVIYLSLGKVLNKVCYPFKKLYEWLSGLGYPSWSEYSFKRTALYRFFNWQSVFGTGKSITFLLLYLIFSGLFVLFLSSNGTLTATLEEIFLSFPFIFAGELWMGNIEFSVVSVISTGVSALLISRFFNLLADDFFKKGKHTFWRWPIAVVYYAIGTFAACCLSLILTNVWDWCANTGVLLFNNLSGALNNSNWSFVGTLSFIGCILAFLLLLYVGVIVALTAIREYVDVICYGGVGLVIFLIIILMLHLFGLGNVKDGAIMDVTITVLGIIFIFAFDFIRVVRYAEEDEI